jgi:Na+-transporting NADH:ubiquinone oxidoreductase subunit NqrF
MIKRIAAALAIISLCGCTLNVTICIQSVCGGKGTVDIKRTKIKQELEGPPEPLKQHGGERSS